MPFEVALLDAMRAAKYSSSSPAFGRDDADGVIERGDANARVRSAQMAVSVVGIGESERFVGFEELMGGEVR